MEEGIVTESQRTAATCVGKLFQALPTLTGVGIAGMSQRNGNTGENGQPLDGEDRRQHTLSRQTGSPVGP
jgi:hypothetical protein